MNEELVTKALDTFAEKIAKDFDGNLKQLAGQIQENGKASQDALTTAQGLELKLKEIGEKDAERAKQIEELVVKFNRPDFDAPAADEDIVTKSLKSIGQQKGWGDKPKDSFAQIVGKMADGETSGVLRYALPSEALGLGLNTKAVANITSSNITNGPVTRMVDTGITTTPLRRQNIRSFIPQRALTGAQYEFVKTNTPTGEGGADYQSSEGATKPTTDYDFTRVVNSPFVLAVTATVSRQVAQDFPELISFMTTDMVNGNRGILYKEDNELLYGTGSSALHGINTQATAYVANSGTNKYDYLLQGIFSLLDADYDVTNVMIRPLDYSSLLQLKSTAGEYTYPMLYVPGGQQPMTIAGVPLTINTAITSGTALLGDFSASNVEMFIREGLTVEMSYEHANNFTQNLMTIRVEERIGLAVKLATAFKKITFATFNA